MSTLTAITPLHYQEHAFYYRDSLTNGEATGEDKPMARNVVLDTLELEGANLWVDLQKGEMRLEMNYSVGSAAGGVRIGKCREAQEMLTPGERAAILALAARLKGVLEQEELS
jgi:hypothetical protein